MCTVRLEIKKMARSPAKIVELARRLASPLQPLAPCVGGKLELETFTQAKGDVVFLRDGEPSHYETESWDPNISKKRFHTKTLKHNES